MRSLKKLILSFSILVLVVSPFTAFAQQDDVVTATVQPQKTDAEFSISSNPANTTIVHEGDEVTYTIQYKSNLTAGSFPFSLTTSWSKGLINGTNTYIDAMDYVVGSASTADDGTTPVVDLVNRQITWNMPALGPSGGFHTVSYKLKVHSPLSTTQQVTVTTTGNATFSTTDLDPQTLETTIQSAGGVTSPTATPGPTSSPTTSGTPAPTPTPAPSFTISNINFTQITDTSAEIEFTTSENAAFNLQYGLQKNNLTDIITSSTFSKLHNAALTNLLPDTRYFFRLRVTNKQGKVITSDIFTFKTAKSSETLDLTPNNLSLYSNDVLLTSDRYTNIVLPNEGSVTIQLRFSQPNILSKLTAEFRRRDVLGATTDKQYQQSEFAFVETTPGVLTATVQTPDVIALYNLVLNMQTKNGTLLTKTAPYIFYISRPITVVNAGSHELIDGAYVNIYRYQESYHSYSPIDRSIEYDKKTDYKGTIHIALPSGKYKIESSAVGYEKTVKEVELGTKNLAYPEIELKKTTSISAFIESSIDAIQYKCQTFIAQLLLAVRSSQTLKTVFTLLTLLEVGTLILFYVNRKKYDGKRLLFRQWLFQFMLVSTLSVTTLLCVVLSILFTIYQGILHTLPLVLLTVINILFTKRLLNYLWRINN